MKLTATTLLCWPTFQRWPSDTYNSLTARALFQAEKLLEFARQNPEFSIVRNRQQLSDFIQKRANNPKMVAGLIGTEGSHALDGKLANIDVLFAKGFRMMSLQHFFDNKLGASLHGVAQTGLTEFGRQAIRRMDELGIMLDVSHSSEIVVEDVLALTQEPPDYQSHWVSWSLRFTAQH